MSVETPETVAEAKTYRHVDDFLLLGQRVGASDIHLGVNSPPIWRLHGILQPIWADAPGLTAKQTAALANGFLSDLHKEQLERAR